MREMISKILNEYISAKSEVFAKHPLGDYFRKKIPDIIYKTGLVDPNTYLVTGSVGQGNWAAVPWVCIFDRRITTSATKGVYIVYLLSKDGNTLYLTFMQGCTDVRKTHSKQETIQIMRSNAAKIVGKIDARGFKTDEDIFLGTNLTELAELYQRGTIFYKAYHKDSIPPEDEIRDDLSRMMAIYMDYANPHEIDSIDSTNNTNSVQLSNGGEKELSIKDSISWIKQYILSQGFHYEENLIENFYLSLKSKPFVILAGTSGTGKTRLVRLFASAIGAEYKMVSVRPDWSDSSDLFGHVDLNGRFVPGPIIDFIHRAGQDISRPYFLCLDEMNLARVEYYLSDILSIIETRDFHNGIIETDPILSDTYYGSDIDAKKNYGEIKLPENLYIVGTVNMDETTFPFSRKVLDRANTIEFSFVDLMPQFIESNVEENTRKLPNSFLKSEYLLLAQCKNEQDLVGAYCSELQDINKILQKANAHVGYRVRDEIVFYLVNNHKAELMSEEDAMDYEIMQKILPRIQGSSAAIKKMLCELFKYCAGDFSGYQTEDNDISAKMFRAAQDPNCKYRKSAEKIAFMVRRYEEDGFTSYWL